MDKETLSNYGWIVIAVLVLAVMIALAGPFGNFVAAAVKSTTQGLFDVNQKALNNTNLITIDDQEFSDAGTTVSKKYQFMDSITQGEYRYTYIGCDNSEEYETGSLRLVAYYMSGTACQTQQEAIDIISQSMYGESWASMQLNGYTKEMLIRDTGITLTTYEEAQNNGAIINGWWITVIDTSKTEYEAIPEQVDGIPVVSMESAFYECSNLITAPAIPNTVTEMRYAFTFCSSLTTIPSIPNGVNNLTSAFTGCTALSGTIEIPSACQGQDIGYSDVTYK